MKKIVDYVVFSGCLALGIYFTVIQFTRYLKNEDYSSLSYHKFEFKSGSKEEPPTYTICFTGLYGDSFINKLKDDWEVNGSSVECYNEFLLGKPINESNFDCPSSDEILHKYLEIEFEELVTSLIKDVMLAFLATDLNEEVLTQYSAKNCAENHSDCLEVPFYKTFQDANEICYTRHFDYEKDIDFEKDLLFLNLTAMLEEKQINMMLYIHERGQFLRYRATTGFYADYQLASDTFNSIYKVEYPQGAFLLNEHMISDVVLLRERANGIIPCNETLTDEDGVWISSIVEEWIGCTPAYWTVFLDNSSFDTNLDRCLPEQYEYIRKEILPSSQSNFGTRRFFEVFDNASKSYLNPCSTMQKSIVQNYASFGIDHVHYLAPELFLQVGLDVADMVTNHHSFAKILIGYKGNTFMEIKNSQAFNEETWLSQTGGFIGT